MSYSRWTNSEFYTFWSGSGATKKEDEEFCCMFSLDSAPHFCYSEVKEMIKKANEEAEKNVIKTNKEFHDLMDNRKKSAEERIKQLRNQALKDIKNASVKIAIESVEKLIKNSLDKSKLDKIYSSSLEETKLALKKKSS